MSWIIAQGFSAGPAGGVPEITLCRDGYLGIFFSNRLGYLLLVRRGGFLGSW